MSNQGKSEYNLIDYLLFVMEDPEYDKEVNAHDWQVALQIKKMMDEMPGGFFAYRADGDEEIIYANKAVPRIFNCDTIEEFRELTGNSFRGVVHPDDLEQVEESIKEQIQQSQYDLDYVEYRIIQKGGGIRWVDDYGHFVHSRYAGDIFYVFIGDSTDKKNTQFKEKEALQQKQIQRLEMIEGLSIDYESIFYADLDANTIQPYRVSRRMIQEFGDSADSLREYNGFDENYIRTWVYPEDQEVLKNATSSANIREKLKKDRSFYVYYRVFSEDKLEHLQLRVVDVGNDNHISQVILGYRSVDERVRSEMEQKKLLEIALNRAKSAIVAKDTFLANMSHDIRTPMNAIIGYTALAKREIDHQKKVWNYLNQIEATSNQLMKLLQNVLEISRIEAGGIPIENAEINLLDILHGIENRAILLANAKNIHVLFSYSHIQHGNIFGDGQKLTQIIECIVGNAIKYTGNSGNVSLMVTETASTNDYVNFRFVIEDNGIGISEKFIEKIFDPFEREMNTTLSGVQGTGLGLTITKSFVEMLGGNIQVESRLGMGSRFIVTLSFPIQKKEKALPKDKLKTKPTGLHNANDSKRLLLVEDNELNLEIEVELLQDAGFLLDTAENGKIAVDKVKESEPFFYDLILMDIQMPVMDGYEATRAIRSLPDPWIANIPIIALSANIFDEDRKKSMESGMNLHMAKPIDFPLLLEAIHEIIG